MVGFSLRAGIEEVLEGLPLGAVEVALLGITGNSEGSSEGLNVGASFAVAREGVELGTATADDIKNVWEES